MEFCKQVDDLVKLLNAERKEASSKGYSTVTLTHEEVTRITRTLSQANWKISHRPNQ